MPKKIIDLSEIDEKALLESIANRSTNGLVLPRKKEQFQKTNETEPNELFSPTDVAEESSEDMKTFPSKSTKKNLSGKQRKASLQEYQQIFLSVPKITDRKTIFISNKFREQIVGIVRRLGTEKSSVSGFIENLVIHHLGEYEEDIENWKKL